MGMERHSQTVRLIAANVRAFFDRAEPYRIFHGSTNSTRPSHLKSGTRYVDISALSNVLDVNRQTRVALVEPNVPMDRLVEHTLRHGLVPPVVMEFPGITAGGGFAGTAGESSSFRHGYFDSTVRGVEMVLPDGEVVRAEPAPGTKYHDLFHGAVGAVGSLGVTTLLELDLVEAKRFVRTTYRRVDSVAEAVRVVREQCRDEAGNDYVDGILFSKTHGVVITGRMTDEAPPAGEKVQTFSHAWDPWFYMHVRERTKALSSSASSASSGGGGTTASEHIPLAEYLFRYDRGGFWVGQAAFDYFKPVPFTRFFRWFLDDFLHTRMLYRALHASGESAHFFVQDLGIPFGAAEEFVDYTSENLGIWPLWLCPLKTPKGPSFHPHVRKQQSDDDVGDMMLNIGVWGWGPSDRDEFVRVNRALENKVNELGGMKWLYAHTYYDEPGFWNAYGGDGGNDGNNNGSASAFKADYEALRRKYKADHMPSVYDKVKVRTEPQAGWKPWIKSLWPVGGLWGIYKGIKSRDYRLHRDATWKWIRGGGFVGVGDGGEAAAKGGKDKLS